MHGYIMTRKMKKVLIVIGYSLLAIVCLPVSLVIELLMFITKPFRRWRNLDKAIRDNAKTLKDGEEPVEVD